MEYTRGAAIIDLTIIHKNIQIVKKMLGQNKLLAVVKANAYGHGMDRVAQTAQAAGADWLGVANVSEGVQLRRVGIEMPILVMGPAFPQEYADIVQNGLVATIFCKDSAIALSQTAAKIGKMAKIHIKLDTGMGRIGFLAWKEEREESIRHILDISKLQGLIIDGIYSHLAASESNPEFSYEQYERFSYTVSCLAKTGLHFPYIHIANSGGILHHPDFSHNMVRAGMLIYGLSPESTNKGAANLAHHGILPALSLKSRLAMMKPFAAGRSVGYGRNFFAESDIVVGTVPIGYGDGISRALSNRGKILVNGKYAPIIGNICMDQFMVNLSGIDAKMGDEIVMIGKSGENCISAEDVATWSDTINYEIVTNIMERIPRLYFDV